MNAFWDRRRAVIETAATDLADILERIDAEGCGVSAAPHLDFALQILRAELSAMTLGRRSSRPR